MRAGSPSPITRAWIAFAAVGAGLIHLALVISSPPAVGVLLAMVGIAAFAWGVLVLFDERFVRPWIAVGAALAPVVVWIAVLFAATTLADPSLAGAFRPLPLGVAALLELFVSVAIALHLRRVRAGIAAREPGTAKFVAGIVVGILVIGGITAPALAATETTTLLPPGTPIHH